MPISALNARRRAALVAAGSAIVFGISCQDDPVTSPKAPTSRIRAAPVGPALDLVYELVDTARFSPLNNAVYPDANASLPSFDEQTLVRVSITGSLSTTLTPFNTGAPYTPQSPGAPRTFGPSGYYWGSPSYSGCGARVWVMYTLGEVFWPTCASDGSTDASATASGHIYAQGMGGASRTSAAPATTGQWDCYSQASGSGPCFYYSTSGQTVKIERVAATLSFVATPSDVQYDDSVAFTGSISPSEVAGKAVPFRVESVGWFPDDTSHQSILAQPCQPSEFATTGSGVKTCKRRVTRSGVLMLVAMVNGARQVAFAHVTVRRPKLILTAVPHRVSPGDTVRFQVSTSPAATLNIQSYGPWIPEVGTGGISLVECQANHNPCKATVTKSGTMMVVANLGNNQQWTDTASASVIVTTTPDWCGAIQCDDATLPSGSGPDTLEVDCDASVTRGNDVHCVTTVSSGAPFTILWRQSTSLAEPGRVYRDTDSIPVATNSSDDWTGKAAVRTRVRVLARVGSQVFVTSDTFGVASRWGSPPWNAQLLDNNRPLPAAAGHPPLWATAPGFYPLNGSFSNGWTTAKGSLGLTQYRLSAFSYSSSSSGPNKPWFFTSSAVAVDTAYNRIWYNESMTSGNAFYQRQTGGLTGVNPPDYCNSTYMNQQRGYVLDHENAHWQVYSDYLAQHNVQARVEALVLYDLLEKVAYEDAVFGRPAESLSENSVHTNPNLNRKMLCLLRP
jgi:hypothetical protein